MSTRTEFPDFRGNTGKFLKVNPTETDVLWDVISVDASDITGVLGIDHGGTGANNADDALNNLLPTQTGNAGESLHTNGTGTYWGPDGSGGVQSVTGLNTDNTDAANPVVKISVDGTTITGAGTPASPLVAVTGGTGTVTSIATTSPITGGTITSTGTIGISKSNTSTDGYLSSSDWNTFNNKQSTITTGNLSTSTTGVTVGTGTNKLIGGAATVDIQTASGSQPGLLSAANWNTFNGKESVLTFNNGLTRTSNNVALGGNLTASTTVGTASFPLLVGSNVTFNTSSQSIFNAKSLATPSITFAGLTTVGLNAEAFGDIEYTQAVSNGIRVAFFGVDKVKGIRKFGVGSINSTNNTEITLDGSIQVGWTRTNGNTNFTISDSKTVCEVDNGASATIITLPALTGSEAGRILSIFRGNSLSTLSTGTITINAIGTDKIESTAGTYASTQTLGGTISGSRVTFVVSSVGWQILNVS